MALPEGESEALDVQTFKLDLAEEVRQRSALYDSNNPVYKDHKKVESLWGEVVDALDPDGKFDISVEFAKKHWKALRDDFFRRDKKMSLGEVTREKALKWPMFATLEFLRPHSKRNERKRPSIGDTDKETVEVIVIAPPPVKIKSEASDNEDKPIATTSPKTGAAKRKATSRKGNRKRSKTVEIPDLSPEVDVENTSEDPDLDLKPSENGVPDHDYTLEVGQVAAPVENANFTTANVQFVEVAPKSDVNLSARYISVLDTEDHFAESVAGTLRRFTPILRATAKLKIQQLLYDLEFGAESVTQIQTSHSIPATATIVVNQSNGRIVTHSPSVLHH